MSEEPQAPSEEELHAAWEEQLRRLTPADLIVQTVVSLINLAGRRLGLDAASAAERDLEQARDGIDGARALMPVLERREGQETLKPLRDALSALQLEYAKLAGSGGGEPPPQGAQRQGEEQPPETGAGPAQRSGRLWVPGQ
jgi:hypothetical protein